MKKHKRSLSHPREDDYALGEYAGGGSAITVPTLTICEPKAPVCESRLPPRESRLSARDAASDAMTSSNFGGGGPTRSNLGGGVGGLPGSMHVLSTSAGLGACKVGMLATRCGTAWAMGWGTMAMSDRVRGRTSEAGLCGKTRDSLPRKLVLPGRMVSIDDNDDFVRMLLLWRVINLRQIMTGSARVR